MIDEFTDGRLAKPTDPAHIEAQEQGLIRIKNAIFTWGSAHGSATPGFQLDIPDVTFVKGKINLIAGPTGSGKSSLLKVSNFHAHCDRR
jgi:ABC-type lipoprotein export system ATPase subunit